MLHASSRLPRHTTQALGLTLIGSGSPIVVERRAADVLVLGDSAVAAAAALSLARRGKKVVHILDYGVQQPPPSREALRPLQLLDVDPQLVSLFSESAAYFDGLEMQAGIPLLWRTKSLDVAATNPHSAWPAVAGGVGSPTSLLLSQLTDAAKQAGVKIGGVKPDDLLTSYPMLRLGNEISGCLQPDGGVINAAAVQGALRTLGKRSGVMLRDNLVLKGWRDTGSCLRVHASSRLQPDAVSVFEAEQVLLAPSAWPLDCLQLWGLQLRGLELVERCTLSCGAASDLSRLPLLRYWEIPLEDAMKVSTHTGQQGNGSGSEHDPSKQRSSSMHASDTAAEVGQRADKPSSTAGLPTGATSFTLFPRVSTTSSTSKLVTTSLQARRISTCWQLSEGMQKGAQGEVQTALRTNWHQAAAMVKGLSGPPPISDDGEDVGSKQVGELGMVASSAIAWDVVAADGLPVIGWHPSFEPGRVMLAIAAGATGGRQTDAFQMTPLIAKAAADLLQGQATIGLPMDAERLAPCRSALACSAMQGKEWGADDVVQHMQCGDYCRAQRARE